MNADVAEIGEPPRPALAIREDDFRSWIANALPGDRIEYHRGHLAIDRVRGTSPFGARRCQELNAIADHGMALAAEGRLLLVQQRHGEGDYSYFAVKAKRPTRKGGR